MASRAGAKTPTPPARGHCQCGHLATHHMVVVPVAGTGGFRLAPSGPCQVCGEAGCRQFTPSGRLAPPTRQP